MPQVVDQPAKRSRSLTIFYVVLGVAGASVLIVVLCWAIPLVRVRYATSHYPVGDPAAVAALGGPDSGVALTMNYLRSSVIPGDWKADAMSILDNCAETCSERGALPLAQSLGSSDWHVRWVAAHALLRMGPKAKPAVPALVHALASDDPQLRKECAQTLGAIGREASETASALRRAAQSGEDPAARIAAAAALWRVDETSEQEAVTLLIRELTAKSSDKHDRRDAAHALGHIGPAAKAAVPALAYVLDDGFAETRSAAAGALGKIGPDAQMAVPRLIKALSDNDRFVRLRATRALGSIGSAARNAVPALEKVVEDRENDVRTAADEALKKIRGEEAKP